MTAPLPLAADFAEAHLGRALALQQLGRLDDALASIDRALALKPALAAAHKARASVLQAMERADEAQVSMAKAAELESQAGKDSGPPTQ